MPTNRHNLTGTYTPISSSTGSIFVESGFVDITNQASQPQSDAPVMDELSEKEGKPIKVKSGETLYAKASSGSSATITYTEI